MTFYEYSELSAWSLQQGGTPSLALSPFFPSAPSPRTRKVKKVHSIIGISVPEPFHYLKHAATPPSSRSYATRRARRRSVRTCAVAPAKRAEIWADAGTCYQRRRPGSGSRFCRRRVSHRVRSWLSSLAYASSAMRVCVYLTVASSQYAVALSRPHTLPYLGRGNTSQVIAPGSLDRQGLGLHGRNSCQSNLCDILKFIRDTGVGE